jgi:hypothetical protein
MAVCEVCGNDYDKAFSVTQAGKTMTFDSFECAIHAVLSASAMSLDTALNLEVSSIAALSAQSVRA